MTPTKNGIVHKDARDRAPPPAPKKLRTTQGSPAAVYASPLFLEGPTPGAPQADRTRCVSLCDQPLKVRELAAKQIATIYHPAFVKAQREDPDLARDEALEEAVKVTPLELSDGEMKDYLLEHVDTKTFSWNTEEIWVERNFSQEDGRVSTLNVCLQRYTPTTPEKYKFTVESLSRMASEPQGHWEEIGTGKGGKDRFWVEAEALN